MNNRKTNGKYGLCWSGNTLAIVWQYIFGSRLFRAVIIITFRSGIRITDQLCTELMAKLEKFLLWSPQHLTVGTNAVPNICAVPVDNDGSLGGLCSRLETHRTDSLQHRL